MDAGGAAGAEDGVQASSTAGWLRRRLRMGAGAASSSVRTARALFRGPLVATAKALTNGDLSPAHATVLAAGTHDLPTPTAAEAEPVLLEAAQRLDPPRLRGSSAHLQLVADPDGADCQTQRRHERRGLWTSPTLDGMVAIDGLRRRVGGLACEGAVTRVLVTRQPTRHQHHQSPTGHHHSRGDPSGQDGTCCDDPRDPDHHGDPTADQSLTARLRLAAALLPPVLGGAPSQPLDVGRTTRVVQPAQRVALAVRDGGCVFPGCDRPLFWCDAHHLIHWLDGGPTDLANLALLCRAHHRAVHEGGWQLARAPDGQLTATPSHRPHRRRPAAA